MSRINYLLDKYETGKYVQGGYETPKQYQQRYNKQQLTKRLQILEDLLIEEPKLNLTHDEKEQVKYLLQKCNNFKKLYNRGREEMIILSFIFFMKLGANSRLYLHEWSICRKYGLNNRTYSLIITRVLKTVLKIQPLQITPTTKYDHGILEKQSL